MNQDVFLSNQDSQVALHVVRTSDKALAKQLAAHHLALAQVYLKMAGEKPIMTGSQQRKAVANVNR